LKKKEKNNNTIDDSKISKVENNTLYLNSDDLEYFKNMDTNKVTENTESYLDIISYIIKCPFKFDANGKGNILDYTFRDSNKLEGLTKVLYKKDNMFWFLNKESCLDKEIMNHYFTNILPISIIEDNIDDDNHVMRLVKGFLLYYYSHTNNCIFLGDDIIELLGKTVTKEKLGSNLNTSDKSLKTYIYSSDPYDVDYNNFLVLLTFSCDDYRMMHVNDLGINDTTTNRECLFKGFQNELPEDSKDIVLIGKDRPITSEDDVYFANSEQMLSYILKYAGSVGALKDIPYAICLTSLLLGSNIYFNVNIPKGIYSRDVSPKNLKIKRVAIRRELIPSASQMLFLSHSLSNTFIMMVKILERNMSRERCIRKIVKSDFLSTKDIRNSIYYNIDKNFINGVFDIFRLGDVLKNANINKLNKYYNIYMKENIYRVSFNIKTIFNNPQEYYNKDDFKKLLIKDNSNIRDNKLYSTNYHCFNFSISDSLSSPKINIPKDSTKDTVISKGIDSSKHHKRTNSNYQNLQLIINNLKKRNIIKTCTDKDIKDSEINYSGITISNTIIDSDYPDLDDYNTTSSSSDESEDDIESYSSKLKVTLNIKTFYTFEDIISTIRAKEEFKEYVSSGDSEHNIINFNKITYDNSICMPSLEYKFNLKNTLRKKLYRKSKILLSKKNLCLVYLIMKFRDRNILKKDFLKELTKYKKIINGKYKYNNDVIVNCIINIIISIRFGPISNKEYKLYTLDTIYDNNDKYININDFIFTKDGIRSYIFKYFRTDHEKICYHWIYEVDKLINLIMILNTYFPLSEKHDTLIRRNYEKCENKNDIMRSFVLGQRSGYDSYLYKYYPMKEDMSKEEFNCLDIIRDKCYFGWCFFHTYHDEITFLQNFDCNKSLYQEDRVKIPVRFDLKELFIFSENELK
jgi:hypothetical protein